MARLTEEDIVRATVDALRAKRTKVVTAVINNGDGTYTLFTPCTFDTVAGHLIDVLGNSVKVTAVVQDVSITVKSSVDLLSAIVWNALGPYFFFGNPITISNEMDKVNNQNANYPAIILFEVQNVTVFPDPIASLDRESGLNIFFMDQANYEDSTNQDLYDNVVDRMEELSIEFIKEIRKVLNYRQLTDTFPLAKFSKWGVSVVRNGVNGQDTIFNNDLSGVEINFTAPIDKNLNVKCGTCDL